MIEDIVETNLLNAGVPAEAVSAVVEQVLIYIEQIGEVVDGAGFEQPDGKRLYLLQRDDIVQVMSFLDGSLFTMALFGVITVETASSLLRAITSEICQKFAISEN